MVRKANGFSAIAFFQDIFILSVLYYVLVGFHKNPESLYIVFDLGVSTANGS